MSKFSAAEVRYGQRRFGATRQMYNDVVDAIHGLRWAQGNDGTSIVQLERSLPQLKRAVVVMERGRMPAEYQVGIVSALAEGRIAMRKLKSSRMFSRRDPERSSVNRRQAVVHLVRANSMLNE